MISRKIFLKIGFNTFFQIFGKGVIVLLGLISIAALTRYLGTENYGNFTLAFAYGSFFNILTDFGLQLVAIRDLSNNSLKKSTIINTYFFIRLILIALSMMLAIACLQFFPYSPAQKTGIILAVLAGSVSGVTGFGITMFNYWVRLDLVSLVDVVTRAATVAFILIFVYLRLSFYAIVTTVLLGNLIGLLFTFFFLRKKITITLSFDIVYAKKLLYASIPIGSALFLYSLYVKVDTIILSLYKSASEVGIYNVAYKVFENILVLWGFYIASVYPLWTKFYKSKAKKNFYELLKTSFIVAIALSIFVIFVGYLLAPILITVLGGNKFMNSIFALRIILFAAPFYFINNMFYFYFLIIDKKKLLLGGILGALIVNVAMNLLFIPRYGYIGASFITIATEVILTVFYSIMYMIYG